MRAAASLEKLTTLLGPVAARTLVETTMSEAGLSDLDDPDQLARFAEALVKKGGLIGAVGSAIKIQAIFAGAKAPLGDRQGPRVGERKA